MNAPILEATEEKLERVRSYFRGDLLVLRETLLRMASIAHTNLQLALESLVERSAEKAKKAIQDDMEIDRLEVRWMSWSRDLWPPKPLWPSLVA